jgi:protein-L-isoaspartate(D-aspartate) O-methyltransferase
MLSAWVVAALLAVADPYAAARERMVRDHIEARSIRNASVLRAMRETPRHLFVPQHLRAQAYADHPLPIGFDATISQPYIVALMTELLDPGSRHRVLEIGTGSGYQAAILARVSGSVYSIELVPELARSAEATLKKLGHENVQVRAGDGYKGWPEAEPFDRIILTAAPPEVPRALLDQLAKGGRLVAPVGAHVMTQELVVIDKGRDGSLKRRTEGGVRFVPMRPGL